MSYSYALGMANITFNSFNKILIIPLKQTFKPILLGIRLIVLN